MPNREIFRPGTQLFLKLSFSTCILTLHAIAQSQTFDPKPWLQDYASLKHTLEKSYSNLAWFASPEGGVDLPALDRRTLAAIESAHSDDEARRALLSFVRSFHDGHFSSLRTEAAPRASGEKPPPPVYSQQDAAGGCAALGYGPVRDSAFSLPFDSLEGFHLLADGTTRPFRAGTLWVQDPQAGVQNPQPRLGIVRIPEFENNYRALCLEAWGRSEVWDPQGKFIRGALRRAIDQAWYHALADLLRKFKDDGVAAVLVDIGNNSGGGDSGDIAARLFTTIPLHSAPLWMSQDPDWSTPYFDEQITALRRVLEIDADSQQAQKSLAWFTAQKEKLAQTCPMDWVWRERRAWSSDTCRRLVEAGTAGGPLSYLAPDTVADVRVAQRLHWPALVTPLWGAWTGPVYVLTDNKTYSAAEMFAAVMQNNRAARIVGRPTGGDGCGFMNSTAPVVLPNSGLRFRVPNCVRLRADSTDEVAGVRPDLPILPAEGEDPKAIAERVRVALFEDLKRSTAGK